MPRSAWPRWLPHSRLDASLAGILVLVGQSQVWAGWNDSGVGQVPDGDRVMRSLLVIGMTAPLGWRRLHPFASVTVICAAIVTQLVAVTAYVPFLAGLLPLAIVNYTAAAYAPRWPAASLPLVLATEAVIYARIPEERVGGEVLFAVFVLLGTWVVGDVVRQRLHRADRTVGAARALLAEREAAAVAALIEERAQIARELHDVIAHSVSLMGVQAGAARTLMDTDPDSARESLRVVEDTARTSVAELQRLLAVLREPDASPSARNPQPGLADLTVLVDQVRTAGLAVTLDMPASPTFPSGVNLAAYRIVQEALTNALKHAHAPTHVSIGCVNGNIRIEVRDHGPGRSTRDDGCGHGLIGMRERALLYGGDLAAGPHPDGGFAVVAHLPVATSAPP